MRKDITIEVSTADRVRLELVVADRNSPQKHVWRAGIILATADGFGTAEIMRRTGKSKPCVWRWQARFMTEGVGGLLRDKTRPSRVPPLGPEVAERVVALTLTDPPAETTHWTAAMMAKAAGISVSSVQRIWRAHGLQPHRVRQFKLSNDPRFVEKLRDVVGLYLDPPAHAIVLSVDEKSQIQALDRTQPGLPMKKGRAGTMTHDYKRHGTTTLFAALNVLDGTVIGRNMQRHRHQEFIRFLNAIEAAVPAATKSTRSSTTTPRTSTRRCARGSTAIPAGPSTSCRHPAPGSTPSRASSPSSRSAGSSAGSSTPSSTSRPPSIASSMSITQNRAPSSGPPIRTGSSQPSGEGTKRWILSTSSSRRRTAQILASNSLRPTGFIM